MSKAQEIKRLRLRSILLCFPPGLWAKLRHYWISGLDRDTTYYTSVQAVDTAFAGSDFSSEISFKRADYPFVATLPVSNITRTTAEVGGEITSQGGSPLTERGIVLGVEPSPTIETNIGRYIDSSTAMGTYSATVEGLTSGATYYVRAYGINSSGTAYGKEKVFFTAMTPPGNALAFDGIEVWIRPDAFSSLDGIVSKFQTSGSNGYTLRLSSSGTPQTTAVNTDPVRIGCDYSSRYFNGQIDEVRIWNTARTGTAICDFMNRPISTPEPGTEPGSV